MGYVVAKPFKSVNRKFGVGDPVAPADIDPTSATSFDGWLAIGFIIAAPQEQPVPGLSADTAE